MTQLRHKLSEIDEKTRTATCSVCGPTKIKIRSNKHDHKGKWKCKTVWLRSNPNWMEHLLKVAAENRPAYKSHRKNICENVHCTATIVGPCQLDVHHIDGNHKNDCFDNLVTLCANCHRLATHTSHL